MTSSFAVTATIVMRGLRLGPMRLTPYGLCAGIGLVLAMALAGRSARRIALDPDAAWDAGMFAIASCFIASRLLLIVTDPVAFAHYPVLVLSLPSLTILGMALAALMVLVYLRRKKLPLRSMLDAFAAPAALLAAFLELGHWLDGTEPGMPTALPWGVRDPAVDGSLRVHPVALYGVIASLFLCALLWRLLARRRTPGQLAAIALISGGTTAFFLDMLTQPTILFEGLLLEPGQIVALATTLAGALLWSFGTAPTADVVGVDRNLAAEHPVALDPTLPAEAR